MSQWVRAMPTYVYECRTCEKSFEAEQRITEAPLTDCECGGTVRRIIQPVGIAFRGSGFYVNDSVAKPTETKAGETKAAETKAEEAKPAEAAPAPSTPAPATAPETKTDAP